MEPIKIQPRSHLRGTVILPGDKSISHRAAILAAMARGETEILNFLFSDDCLVTLKVLRALGVKITTKKEKSEVIITSSGSFHAPRSALDMGESGTSVRILLGVLSGQAFKSKLYAAPSLSRRPMARVIEPLRWMGAKIKATKKGKDEFLPLEVYPASLHGIQWKQKIPSAQVKSAVLLAGLFAEGETIVREPILSRDHTERMLELFGANIKIRRDKVWIKKSELITPEKIFIPGDISSAAFFIVAALLTKNSKILIKDVGMNPTRMGAVKVLERMGANIRIVNLTAGGKAGQRNLCEPMADMEVTTSDLRATTIKAEEIPGLIDELPILMVAAGLAKGKTVIEGVGELRVKETDRISSLCSNLMKLGVNIKVRALKEKEFLEILGTKNLKGTKLKSFSDHRTAMSMFVAVLAAQDTSSLDDITCINKSFPQFLSTFKHLFD